MSRNYGLKELPYGTAELPCLVHVVVGKALAQPPTDRIVRGGGWGGCNEVARLAARGVRVQVDTV